MTKWYLPCPDVMKIFSPVTNQLPFSSSTPTAFRRAMSLPASGSVMSMQPHAFPSRISSISFEKRVEEMLPFSVVVVPSVSENISIAIAMPP